MRTFDRAGDVFRDKEINFDIESGGISDDIHYLIAENKVYQNYNTTPWFRKLQKTYKETTSENVLSQIQ